MLGARGPRSATTLAKLAILGIGKTERVGKWQDNGGLFIYLQKDAAVKKAMAKLGEDTKVAKVESEAAGAWQLK